MDAWIDKHGALVDHPDVATPPSKDFYHIFVTRKEFILRVWKIVPPTRGGGRSDPFELKDDYADFKDDDKFHSEVQRLAGTNMLDYLTKIAEGELDYLPRLPKKVLTKIILNLQLEDVSHMSRVNKQFRELCNSCEIWENIYRRYSETPITPELEELAKDKSWKRLFFTNKLQLQMQLRRMKLNPEDLPPAGGYAFITHQEEEQEQQ
ncbi:F-box only protein 36-like [Mizuhopecten yessoensis]|uniref:F-box only protein 36 n=1 Tax=Mizuhopecten yessoensis TaxID=6573 RepID=A0A210Q7D6_MIZYE|nr:F-box only protein 36-like [Mizuhopecten yessoensis]OWF44656.1 F-box only protein 36 [Mizuhopecten yessoensis]